MGKKKGKNQPRNAFYFYMKDLQAQYSAEGRNLSLVEISKFAGDRWKNLTDEEKEVYEEQAKQLKIFHSGTPGYKFASDGTSIEENSRLERQKESSKERMQLTIDNIIKGLGSTEAIASEKFYVGCFNIMCRTDEEYLPAEVGLVEYSLQRGVSQFYHKFIHPGPIPTGFTYSAKAHSEDTHNIPLPCAENAVCNYRQLYDEILAFISPESQMKPSSAVQMYCLSKDIDQNRGCLHWLHYKSRAKGDMKIEVLDLAFLLMAVRAAVNKPYPYESVASDDLQKNTFDYTPDTRCAFHEELDNAYCALGCAKRLCFLFSDSACAYYDVEVTEKHLPKRIAVNTNFETLREPPMDYRSVTEQKRIYHAMPKQNSDESFQQFNFYQSNEVKKNNLPAASMPSSSTSQAQPIKPNMRQPRSQSYAQKLAMLDLQKTTSVLTQGTGIGRGKVPNPLPSKPPGLNM